LLAEGLQDEITMMRVITRRVFRLADGFQDIEDAINLLGALGMASTHLAGLLRQQQIIHGSTDSVTDALSEALSELLTEWGRK